MDNRTSLMRDIDDDSAYDKRKIAPLYLDDMVKIMNYAQFQRFERSKSIH